jgi:hypothetical protein
MRLSAGKELRFDLQKQASEGGWVSFWRGGRSEVRKWDGDLGLECFFIGGSNVDDRSDGEGDFLTKT